MKPQSIHDEALSICTEKASMATLTTIDGIKFTFSPSEISAVTDHDALTGEAVTCVYGLTAAPLKIKEAADTFLGRLGITLKFAKLTRANGSPIWINALAVSTLCAPLPGDYVDGVNCLVSVGSLTQGITEDPAEARAAINACRAADGQL